ncbi:MAG: sigma-70 region 4 domain-containing protein, partial [bacterium]
QLKESYQEALILRYFDGLSFEEIAEALERSPGTVRVLVHRATKALDKLINQNNPQASGDYVATLSPTTEQSQKP